MEILDFNKFASNWRMVAIDPVKEKLSVFLSNRANQIKLVHSNNKSTEDQLRKAVNEEAFISSIIELDETYSNFVDHVENKLQKVVSKFAKSCNDYTHIIEQNEFLKERIEIMEKREYQYLEIISNRKP